MLAMLEKAPLRGLLLCALLFAAGATLAAGASPEAPALADEGAELVAAPGPGQAAPSQTPAAVGPDLSAPQPLFLTHVCSEGSTRWIYDGCCYDFSVPRQRSIEQECVGGQWQWTGRFGCANQCGIEP